MKSITHCGISDSQDFHLLWDLPRLPLTERFGPFDANNQLSFDQQLVISLPTGHVQLKNQFNPQILYTSSAYIFRTGTSAKSNRSVDFFLNYLQRTSSGMDFRSIVDVGGNDLYLARKLASPERSCAVVDPICTDLHGQTVDHVKVIGRFVEEVDFSTDTPPPDLIICRHTLEHVAKPREVVSQWFDQCQPDCLYIIEVPCFAGLLESLRFDAIFHQHYHYYDLESLQYLIWECGGEYLSLDIDHQGSCGGSLLVSFKKAKTPQTKPRLDIRSRISTIESRILRYREQMTVLRDLLETIPGPVYGYGASLMLATLGYHLQTDFSRLECILDDDPAKHGGSYENVPVKIGHTAQINPPRGSSYLITSLENIRPIYRRIMELDPRRILAPMVN